MLLLIFNDEQATIIKNKQYFVLHSTRILPSFVPTKQLTHKTTMKKNSQNTNALLLHLSAFCNYIIPFGGIIVPLILWQTKKGESSFLDHQGKEVVNFNISYLIYQLILTSCLALLLFYMIANHIPILESIKYDQEFSFEHYINNNNFYIPLIFMSVFGFFTFVRGALIIIGSLKAKKGEAYSYPLTLQFIK